MLCTGEYGNTTIVKPYLITLQLLIIIFLDSSLTFIPFTMSSPRPADWDTDNDLLHELLDSQGDEPNSFMDSILSGASGPSRNSKAAVVPISKVDVPFGLA